MELNQLDAATHRYIQGTPKLVDCVFQANDPILTALKTNCREDYGGGREIGTNFFYDGLIGGSYLKGKPFDITQPQVEQQLQHLPKFFEVNVTLFKEDIQVINRGDAAAFRLIDSRMQNAYMAIGAHMAIGLYLNGINANYISNWNGLPEALNDGAAASWDGVVYPLYGTITRGGPVGTALNSIPFNVAGAIELNGLETSYGGATYGTIEPNYGATTVLGYSYIKQNFQTQQRFNDTQDPKIGFNGMKFNSATLIKSRYVPGTYLNGAGAGDPVATTYMRQMSNNALLVYPTIVSETLWWMNIQKPYAWFYAATDPEYSLGFTGFKPAQGNTVVCGQVLFSGAVVFIPRYHKQVIGITG